MVKRKQTETVETIDETLTIKLPLPNDEVIIDFLTASQRTFNEENVGGKLIAYSTMSGMHSAIIDYHKQHKLSIRESTKLEIKQFLSGFKRTVSEAKQNGELPIFEGKRHITFRIYLLDPILLQA